MPSSMSGTTGHSHNEVSGLRSISRKGFQITTRKLPILTSKDIDIMANSLGIAPPEMIFGHNFVSINHNSGWNISFNAFDALERVDKSGASMLKVAYSNEWQKSREKAQEPIKQVVKPFDWSYTTDYKGTLQSNAKKFEPSSTPLPIELLKRPDPILFFDDVILYEDELADNGVTVLSCKIRVMPSCLLLLSRFFLRLDNVIVRLRDTRIYIDLESGHVIREYLSRESSYNETKQVLLNSCHLQDDIPAIMRDPNQLTPFLPVVEKSLENTFV